MNIRSLPKVELHLHYDCSLSYEAVSQLKKSVTRKEYETEFIAPAKCTSLGDFLKRPLKCIELLQTEEGLRIAVDDLFEQLRDDNVLYAELRFAPLQHIEKGLPPERVIAVVEDAVGKASTSTGIEAMIILCTLRHFSRSESLLTAKLVERFHGSRVVALDIAGDEAGYSLHEHVSAFEYAEAAGIPRTAHAGEARGAASVWETLNQLRPSRLGHGVRSIEDPVLVERLKREQIHLEVCPTSNVQTSVLDSYADHPVDLLYREGVPLGINTDTRTTTKITLTEEYERLHEFFGWGNAEFLACNLAALSAAFAPETTKARLEDELQHAYVPSDPPRR